MTVLLPLVIGLVIIWLSKYALFGKWFNPLSIYTAWWSLILSLYEIKLIGFVNLSLEVWLIITAAYAAFLLGSVTVFFARKAFSKNNLILQVPAPGKFDLFADDGKTLKIAIYILSIVGLLAAIQHWMVLIDKFGSIPAVIIRANLIYRMRVEGEIQGTIPYLYITAYAGVFLSGLYTAYKNKLSLATLLPLIAVILKDIATVGRAGIFLGFLEFLSAYFLTRHILSEKKSARSVKKRTNMIFAVLIVVALAVASSSLVRSVRKSGESFKGTSQVLNKMKGGAVISPSIYLYFSSNVGVLSKYFESGGEKALWGENTFLPVYNFLSKLGAVPHPEFYPKGYYIPMWTNSATYLRDLHVDFGDAGLFIVPYLIGLLASFYWFKFYEKHKTRDLIVLVYILLIISFSAFYMLTRTAIWYMSLLLLLIVVPVIERLAVKRSLKISSSK